MAQKEELLAQLEEYDVPTELIETFKTELDSSSLRKKLEDEIAWRREHGEPALQKLQHFETQPKRKEALKGVGVDYDALPQYGKEVLDTIPADKLEDTDFVASFVQSKGFQAQVQEGNENQNLSGADQIVDFSTSQPGFTGPLKAGVITPADFASWDTKKQREFMDKHKTAYEGLTRGQEVTI